ncbi:tol-pal system protein YbgF [Paracoccus sp. p3-h83]|uniref:tol-pal system protein YbgF n=1 Tax=Paracoccus sp. p3-h83 TaxID=3342805 RepID=UPI0035BA4A91
MTAFRPLILAGLLAALPLAAMSQDRPQKLADIRAELTRLAQDIQALRAELMASGPDGIRAAGGVTALDRLNSMEATLSQLTGQTEAIQNRIDRVVTDGTNRIGDLEFRLCEMEEGCDLGSVGQTPPLGNPAAGATPDALSPSSSAPAAPVQKSEATPRAGAPLHAGEQAELDRAQGVLGQGDFRRAADLFAAFAQSYPKSALIGQARYGQGQALAGAGDLRGAAGIWLDAFSGDPDGPRAAASLLSLGQALGQLGQHDAACVTLAEVGHRFAATPEAEAADSGRQALSCA